MALGQASSSRAHVLWVRLADAGDMPQPGRDGQATVRNGFLPDVAALTEAAFWPCRTCVSAT